MTAVERQVEAQRPRASTWNRARVGQQLASGWRVSTQERSAAELTFRDQSVFQVREETLVIIYGGSANRTRREGGRALLERGSLRSRLGELAGEAEEEEAQPEEQATQGETDEEAEARRQREERRREERRRRRQEQRRQRRLLVDTPSARASFRGASGVISVDERGVSHVVNHSGGETVVSTHTGDHRITLAPGEGTSIIRGQAPTAARRIPPRPRWRDDQPGRVVGTVRHGGILRGSWEPVPQARSYRVEIFRDANAAEPVVGVEVPGEVTRFEVRRVPVGTYFIRVASLDAERLESPLSEPLAQRVETIRLVYPGEREDEQPPFEPREGPGAPERAIPVLLGTRVLARGVMRCSLGDQEDPALERVIEIPRHYFVSCIDLAGTVLPGFEVEGVRIEGEAFDPEGHPARLREGHHAILRIALQTRAALPSDLRVQGENVEIEEQRLHRERGLLDLWVRVPAPERPRAGVREPEPVSVFLYAGGDSSRVLGTVVVPTEEALYLEVPPRQHRATQEALGLIPQAGAVSLRDVGRVGSGFWLGLGVFGQGPDQDHDRVRVAAGVRAGLFSDRLRLTAAVPLDASGRYREGGDRGSRDLQLSASSLILDEATLHVAAGADVWIPFRAGSQFEPEVGPESLDNARLDVSVELSLRLLDRLTLRTRQAGIFGLAEEEAMIWASAYGADVWIWGPLSLGVEADLSLGRDRRYDPVMGVSLVDRFAAGVGGGLSLQFEPIVISLGLRGALTRDSERVMSPLAGALSIRGSFEM